MYDQQQSMIILSNISVHPYNKKMSSIQFIIET